MATGATGATGAASTPATALTVGWGAPPDLGAPATFVLLRHGETLLTPQKRFSGSGGSDPLLSDVGWEQAERVAAARVARGTIQAIVASPLTRTRETAGAVAARLGLGVVIEYGLRETDFGAWEGLTFGEVRERYRDDLNAWLASPKAEPTGGGESFAATARRMVTTRDKLVASYAGRTVLLVSHVTPIKTLVRLALGAPRSPCSVWSCPRPRSPRWRTARTATRASGCSTTRLTCADHVCCAARPAARSRRISVVSRSAGRNASRWSSASVMSTAVANDVSVVSSLNSPSGHRSRSGTAKPR